MKPNTPTLAIATGLIARSPAPIRHYQFLPNSAAQLYAELLGFTKCVQPNLPGLFRAPERKCVYAVVRTKVNKVPFGSEPFTARSLSVSLRSKVLASDVS